MSRSRPCPSTLAACPASTSSCRDYKAALTQRPRFSDLIQASDDKPRWGIPNAAFFWCARQNPHEKPVFLAQQSDAIRWWFGYAPLVTCPRSYGLIGVVANRLAVTFKPIGEAHEVSRHFLNGEDAPIAAPLK